MKTQELFLSAAALGMPVLTVLLGASHLCNRLRSRTSVPGPSSCCCSYCGCSPILLPMLSGRACRDPSSWCRGITCPYANVRSSEAISYHSAGSFPPPIYTPTLACQEPEMLTNPYGLEQLGSRTAGTEPMILLIFGDLLLKVAWDENSILPCTSLPDVSAQPLTLP